MIGEWWCDAEVERRADMTLWNGETWICPRCGFVNAILRRFCRNVPLCSYRRPA